MKRRVCVVVSARPSYSRIRSALHAIQNRPDLELLLIVGASALLDRYGDTLRYIEGDGFEIAARIFMVVEGENPVTMAKTTGLGIMELATIFDNLRPDLVLTVADRYETLATAAAASYLNVPIAHVQGGEVTGSIDEKVRHAVTKLANVHFVATERSAERVIKMGEDPEAVFVTGCPSIDLLIEALKTPALDVDVFEKYGGIGERLDLSRGSIVALQHPVTTEYEAAQQQAMETLSAARDMGMPTLWFWPNVDAGSDGISKAIRRFRELERPDNIHFFRSVEPEDFPRLMCASRCIVGNSSAAIREGAFLGTPAVNVGSRQAGRERGRNVIDADYDRTSILEAMQRQVVVGRYPSDPIYGDGKAGERIAGLLASCELRVEKRLCF